MSINPTRALDRLEKTNKQVTALKEKLLGLVKTREELAITAATLLTDIEAALETAGLTDTPEADALRASAVQNKTQLDAFVVQGRDLGAQIHQVEQELQPIWLSQTKQQAAYERLIREYPGALSRHLRHMRHSRMTDSKNRTALTVETAWKEAESIGATKPTPPGVALAKALAGE